MRWGCPLPSGGAWSLSMARVEGLVVDLASMGLQYGWPDIVSLRFPAPAGSPQGKYMIGRDNDLPCSRRDDRGWR